MHFGPQRDEERTITYEYEGFTFKLVSEDPYGFIRVFSLKDKKNLEERFTGNFEAKIGAQKYTNNVLKKLENPKKLIKGE